MKIFRDLSSIPEEYKHCVITLGNFDGLHLGHRAIITQAKAIAAMDKSPLALMTFEPHPREFFARGKNSEGIRIMSLRSKLKSIKSLGVKCVFLMRFNEALTNHSAVDFIKNILVDKLHAQHVITGENFYFGKNRSGDKNLMAQQARDFGFGYTAAKQIADVNGEAISSSKIRNLLRHGKIKEAGILLASPYHISGRVKHGEGRGHKLGFPTANITLGRLFLPVYGVYAVRVRIEGNSNPRNAIANIGIKPTFGINAPLLEVHLFDYENNLYGKRLCVEFIEFIRNEQKFSSLEELKKQISLDCEIAKQIWTVYEKNT